MTTDAMVALAFDYCAAKNRRAARDAMRFCVPDFVFEVPSAPAVRVIGQAAVVAHLESVWESFPDLFTTVTSHVVDATGLVAIGALRGTMRGAFVGVAPTQRAFEVPLVSAFTFAESAIAHERNFVDMLALAVQVGLPAELVASLVPAAA
jgi:predicted ester cyclase